MDVTYFVWLNRVSDYAHFTPSSSVTYALTRHVLNRLVSKENSNR